MTPLICIVGSINEDTTLRVPALPVGGETVMATGRTRSPGGKGANQAAAAAALGARVAFVGAVGGDDAGRAALKSLDSRGIDVSRVAVADESATGAAILLIGDDGENLIVVDAGANAGLRDADVEAAFVGLAPAVTLGQLEVPVSCLVAASRASGSARGGLFLLNPAPMPDDPEGLARLAGLLPMVDILVPNRGELGRLAGRPTPSTPAEVQDCVEALDFAGALVVTLGSEGVLIRDQGEYSSVPAVPVDAIDTSGAGDVFCGVLAYRLAEGDSLAAGVRRANEAAAVSTTMPGAQVPPAFRG
ncbi:PfkB family carbohydrate kinase [Nocardioides sp. InS609-2]|uniref:PfkB family carbohydrate kinase n=1 Tax=Nocardioides sp. InS609-2 TaxID=2760705 RepID=UPI0020BE023C|nr:PfkB family carbohydrate kinase [Nocardioides sp. InS609-2]